MSVLLDTLIKERKAKAEDYEKYLAGIVELTKQVHNPVDSVTYPKSLDTSAKRSLFDNLGSNEHLALTLDTEIRKTKKDDWRGNRFKEKEVRNAIRMHLNDDTLTEQIFELVKSQPDY
jgi:type I restriction enzyme R subunit